jgi:hypothetical protein
LFVGAGIVPARLCAHAARRATTTRAFTLVFDGLWVAPTNAVVVERALLRWRAGRVCAGPPPRTTESGLLELAPSVT